MVVGRMVVLCLLNTDLPDRFGWIPQALRVSRSLAFIPLAGQVALLVGIFYGIVFMAARQASEFIYFAF